EPPGGDRRLAGDHADGRALAGAVRAEHAEAFALADVERYVIDRSKAAIPFDEAGSLDWVHRDHSPGAGAGATQSKDSSSVSISMSLLPPPISSDVSLHVSSGSSSSYSSSSPYSTSSPAVRRRPRRV